MTERDLRHRPVPRPWYRKAWFTWLVVIGVAVVFVAILVYPVAAMDDQSYCTSCKAMKPAEKTLAASAHTGIDCTQCHIPPGVVAASKWRLTEAKNVWADYLGMPSTAEKEHTPTNANCLECHPLSGIPDETAGVRMNHAAAPRAARPAVRRLPRHGVAQAARSEGRRQHGHLRHVPQRAGRARRLRLLPRGAAGVRARARLHEGARQGGAGQRRGVPPLPSRQEGVLRQVPRLPAVVPLLGAVALHARQGRRGGSRELRRPATTRPTARSATR